MCHIIFETHATSSDNEMGIASGHNDSPLSAIGIQQAHQLGKRYQSDAIEAVYCSDLARSHETAKIAFHESNVPIIIDKRLREWNYGKYNGDSLSTVEKLKPHHIHDPFPEGESLNEAVMRIIDFTKEFINKNSRRTHLVIGHRSVYYALEHYYNLKPLEKVVVQPWQWQPGWHYFLDENGTTI